jgi:hypothetical protein
MYSTACARVGQTSEQGVGVRRFGGLGIVVIAVALAIGTLVPVAEAAPIAFSPNPVHGWSTNGPVWAVLTVGNTVYVGGDFTRVTGPGGSPTVSRSHLAAFDRTTGAVINGFSSDVNGVVRELVSDGTRLYVGGTFSTVKSTSRQNVAAVDLTSGAVATGFIANTNSGVYALGLAGDRLYVGGAFSTIGSSSRNRFGAVTTATGAVITAFAPPAPNDTVHAIVQSPDGSRVYAGGDFTSVGGSTHRSVAAFATSNGALQSTSFYFPSDSQIIDLDISPAGDRLFAGVGGTGNQALALSTSSGSRIWSHTVDGDVQALRYFDGNVYFGFHEGDIGDGTVRLLVADADSGAIDPSYRLPMSGFWGVRTISVNADALVIGGEFTSVSGVSLAGLAILPGTGGSTTSTSTSTSTSTTSTSTSTSTSTTTTTTTTIPNGPPGTTTLVAAGSTWRYLDNGSDQGSAWRATGFSDAAWKQGAAELGYGDGDEATVVGYGPNANSKYVTTYFRRQITVDPSTLGTVTLRLKRDDGALVYLNGTEIVRSNMRSGNITYSMLGEDAGDTENQFFSYAVPKSAFVNGTNTLAVEVHQGARTSSDVSFDLSLTSVIP